MKQSQFFTPKEKTPHKKIVATYRYDDKDGGHVMDVVRFKPKGFRPRRPDGKWTLDGVTRVPYLLPQMLAAIKEGREIIIVEGEKDCDNAEKFGLVATTFAGGTGKWLEEYSKWFQEAKVICLPDNDDAGRKGMRLIASEIVKVAESVSWLELPDIPAKGDLSDWLKIDGNNIEKFSSLVRQSSSIWKSELVKEDDNGKLLEELNQKFAIVPTGNKFTIVNETENETMFLAPSDFRLALQNRFATDSSGKFPKQVQASTLWLKHPERREYKSVDFIPIEETPYGVFNMWKGFAVKPIGGLEDIPLFHELIDDVICSGNEQWALYLWGWLAHMVQFPKEKPGVAVVLRSDAQGVGKSRFAEYVGSLLGRHFRAVTHGRHIHGNFNSHLKDTLMLFGDEAVWGGDRRTESILKQLITEPNMIIEMKGKDVFEVRSYLRLMLATNSEWAAPVGLTDRRYFVLNVSNSRKNDHNFFKRLIYEQNHGGIEALLQVLMDFDLSDFEVRNIPETPARLDQKFLSMEPIEKWWLEILSNEDFLIGGKILDFDDMNRVAKADLLYSFNEHTKAYKPNHRNWEARRLCSQFKKLVPFAMDKRRGSGPREYEFPSLNECKLYFAEMYSLDTEIFEIS
ncbi:MAG: hypothetical protein CL661_11370 [Bacteroidetes bacterium]|nr:hypothetical protein [Bacteroidota bacterium]